MRAMRVARSRSTSAGAASSIPSPAPYAAANGHAYGIAASHAGLYRITAAAVATVGSAANVCVALRGTPVAVHEPGDGSVIFYAPAPGDRYNSADIYWVTNTAGCPRAASQGPGSLGVATNIAFDTGSHRDNKVYYQYQPGADKDHFFSAELTLGTAPAWTLALPPRTLPGAAGTTTIFVKGVTKGTGTYGFALGGNSVAASASWSGAGEFAVSASYAGSALPSTLTLNQGVRIYTDEISWQRPATLDFSGGAAAFFAQSAGTYQIANDGNGTLYDVTNPAAPIVVSTSPASGPGRRFGSAAGRSYILFGAATLTDISSFASATYDPDHHARRQTRDRGAQQTRLLHRTRQHA